MTRHRRIAIVACVLAGATAACSALLDLKPPPEPAADASTTPSTDATTPDDRAAPGDDASQAEAAGDTGAGPDSPGPPADSDAGDAPPPTCVAVDLDAAPPDGAAGAAATYTALDAAGAWESYGAGVAFSGGTFDGRFVYLAPAGSVTARFDTQSDGGFASPSAWATRTSSRSTPTSRSSTERPTTGGIVYLAPVGRARHPERPRRAIRHERRRHLRDRLGRVDHVRHDHARRGDARGRLRGSRLRRSLRLLRSEPERRGGRRRRRTLRHDGGRRRRGRGDAGEGGPGSGGGAAFASAGAWSTFESRDQGGRRVELHGRRLRRRASVPGPAPPRSRPGSLRRRRELHGPRRVEHVPGADAAHPRDVALRRRRVRRSIRVLPSADDRRRAPFRHARSGRVGACERQLGRVVGVRHDAGAPARDGGHRRGGRAVAVRRRRASTAASST